MLKTGKNCFSRRKKLINRGLGRKSRVLRCEVPDNQSFCTECLLFLHKMFIGLHKMFIDFTQNVYPEKAPKSPIGGLKNKKSRPRPTEKKFAVLTSVNISIAAQKPRFFCVFTKIPFNIF